MGKLRQLVENNVVSKKGMLAYNYRPNYVIKYATDQTELLDGRQQSIKKVLATLGADLKPIWTTENLGLMGNATVEQLNAELQAL